MEPKKSRKLDDNLGLHLQSNLFLSRWSASASAQMHSVRTNTNSNCTKWNSCFTNYRWAPLSDVRKTRGSCCRRAVDASPKATRRPLQYSAQTPHPLTKILLDLIFSQKHLHNWAPTHVNLVKTLNLIRCRGPVWRLNLLISNCHADSGLAILTLWTWADE